MLNVSDLCTMVSENYSVKFFFSVGGVFVSRCSQCTLESGQVTATAGCADRLFPIFFGPGVGSFDVWP